MARAAWMPMQKWVPCPKPTWRGITRRTSKRSGSGNSRSSRLADCSSSSTRWPAVIGLAADHRVGEEGATDRLQHALEPHDLLEGAGQQRRVVVEGGELLGGVGEAHQRAGDDLGQRLDAPDEHRAQLHGGLLGRQPEADQRVGDRARRRA